MDVLAKRYFEEQAECQASINNFHIVSQNHSQSSGLSSELYEMLLVIKGMKDQERIDLLELSQLMFEDLDTILQMCKEAIDNHLIYQFDHYIALTLKGEDLVNEIMEKDEMAMQHMLVKLCDLFL